MMMQHPGHIRTSPPRRLGFRAMAQEVASRTCRVVDHGGSREVSFDRGSIEQLLDANRFFWLDLHQPNENDYSVLREVFRFHPLAVEDSEHFGQRPKLDDY